MKNQILPYMFYLEIWVKELIDYLLKGKFF